MTDDFGPFRGAKAILTCGTRLLVMRRDDIPTIQWPGCWDLPGGGAEPGEGPLDCVLREVAEETGLILAPARLTGAARPLAHRRGTGWYFHAEITEAEAAGARLGDEGDALELMEVSVFVAHPKAVPHYRAIVTEILGLEESHETVAPRRLGVRLDRSSGGGLRSAAGADRGQRSVRRSRRGGHAG